MKTIKASNYSIAFEADKYLSLDNYLSKINFSTLFILVDKNTSNKCLPLFLAKIKATFDFKIICIPAGEDFKNLKTCQYVWEQLALFNADRNSILINLGGGMVTDLGGFVAATFKRGIRFINVSTSLLGMVDASVGGKTGVDFNGLKNQIGLFKNPEIVVIDTQYLKTLPKREIVSGLAEIVKYALTYDSNLWKKLHVKTALEHTNFNSLIYRSIQIKNEVVSKDPTENNLRKILNYGHTIGHAIESHFLVDQSKTTLTHGEAIAVGLVCETYISSKLYAFPEKELLQLKKYITRIFTKINFDDNDIKAILSLMKHDKKNENGILYFVLLENLETYKINCTVAEKLIIESLHFYLTK